MTTKSQKAKADESQVDSKDESSVDTSETVPAGTQTTSDKAPDPPTEVKVDEDAYGSDVEDYFDDGDQFNPDDFSGALGTVKEGPVDAPWAYLTADDFGDAKVRTADTDDKDVVKWNVQHAFEVDEKSDKEAVNLLPVQASPGQTFHVNELPDVESLKAAGIDPVQFLSGLPVRADLGEYETHRRGIPA